MVWLGINDRAIEGIWAGTEDWTPNSLNWYRGQPDSFGGNEDCAALVPNNNELCYCHNILCDTNGQWIDTGCNGDQHFICQAQKQTCQIFEDITHAANNDTSNATTTNAPTSNTTNSEK